MGRRFMLAVIPIALASWTADADAEERGPLPWPSAVAWKTWDDGVKEAQRSKKPICLVVYTSWCPRCRELAPIFATKEILELSRKFVMIHQDRDAVPKWLEAYASTGQYIPRVLFLDSDGRLKAGVKSGIGKYPYFYTSDQSRALVASMKKALGT